MIAAGTRQSAEHTVSELITQIGPVHAADLTDPKWVVYVLAGAWVRLSDQDLAAIARNLGAVAPHLGG